MVLRQRLEALIAAEGPITVETYMALCLHDPQDGYYATRPALGAEGDFLTAPMVSQMFGELIGLWCAAEWMALGSPSPVRWVEMGPGDGTLITDAIRALVGTAPGFLQAADLWLVETSPPLRDLQQAALAGTSARWSERLEDVPGGAPIILIANELLDCLPARQFLKDGAGRWAERRVGLDVDGAVAFGLAPPPQDFAPPPGLAEAPPGVIVEVSAAQAALGAALGSRIARDGGAALFIDYGRDVPEPGDTLQALSKHQKVDPLANPGKADLTVHADFPAVIAAARAVGAEAGPILTQAEFLARLGLGARATALAEANPERAATLLRQVNRLTAPDEMGRLFKAATVYRAGDPAPPAFDEPAPPA